MRNPIGRRLALLSLPLIFSLALGGCKAPSSAPETREFPGDAIAASPSETEAKGFATVTAVEARPEAADSYTFAVTVASPDTGCDQYANWWEVLTPDGELLYRRILAHSHPDEQPFQRAGGPVALLPETTVIVRAHMHPQGYGPQAMQGTVATGFEAVTLPANFAANLATVPPQPQGCAF